MSYPCAYNEKERLRVLRDLQILNVPPDPLMSSICDEAAREFGVPIALVSFIDHDRQWLKARVGMAVSETPRALAFCNYTIQQDRPLVVTDARDDSRFATNPFVLGDPGIRFYAGAPLLFGQNIRLGSLCVIDTKPRDFSRDDVTKLEKLANRVIGCLWAQDMRVNAQAYGFASVDELAETTGARP